VTDHPDRISNKRIVVIGASAGGIETLRQLVSGLPADFPCPIAVVVHTSPQSPGVLDEILSRSGPLTAINARNGSRLRPGRIYVAPPDHHLVIEPGHVRITKGPRENRFRPAIDPLFRSAAQVYGPAAIGVVLTGHLDDGTAGLWAIKQLGGVTIVQDPEDALFPSMPENAIRHVKVDYVVPIADVPALLVRLARTPAPEPVTAPPETLDIEVRIAREEDPIKAGVEQMGVPSKIACPECHGVLLEMKEGGRIRFRCHTGHAFSPESLLAQIGEGIEGALWNAIRSLQEGALLLKQLGRHVDERHFGGDGTEFTKRGDEMLRQADTLREMVTASLEPDESHTESSPAEKP
jgi:two-component system chemotaxis response regulator CheB